MTSPVKIGKTVILGGDARFDTVYEQLCRTGADCVRGKTDSEELRNEIRNADCVILPLPVTRDGVRIFSDNPSAGIGTDELCKLMNPRQKIFGGMVSAALKEELSRYGLKAVDYFLDEALNEYNAVLTAQGLLKTVLDNIQVSLSGRVLITGYGRVGRAAARLFSSCSAQVTVAVRSARDRARALCDGMEAVSFPQLKSRIFIYDIIINTVPAQVIDKSLVRSVRDDALMLEAASAPYGIDGNAAVNYNKKLIACPGLPGKYTPVSAGKIIADTVIRLYSEEEDK